MTYSDDFDIRTPAVKFNDVANAIDGVLTRTYTSNVTGTSTAYIASPNPPWSSYDSAAFLVFVPHVTCGTAPKIKVSDLSFKDLKRNGTSLVAGDLQANVPIMIIYNGSWFETLVVGDSYLAPLYIDRTNQRIGVGTASPLARLSVDPGVIQINQNANSANNFYLSAEANDGLLRLYNGNYDTGTVKALFGNNGHTLYGPTSDSTTSTLLLLGGVGSAKKIQFISSTTAGAFSSIVSAGNSAIVASGSAVDTQDLVIAPWSTLGAGIKIKGSNGYVGVGEGSPLTALHFKHSVPTFTIQDSDAAAGVYATISASGTVGSLVLAADPGNAGASTTLKLAVDGTDRLEINSQGNLGVGVAPDASNRSLWFHGASSTISSLILTNSTTGTTAANQTKVELSGNDISLQSNGSGTAMLWAGADANLGKLIAYSTTGVVKAFGYFETTLQTKLGVGYSSAYSSFSGTFNGTTSVYEARMIADGIQTDIGIRLDTKNNGKLYCDAVYAQTSGSSANVVIGSNGGLVRAGSSSIRYKKNIEPMSKGLAVVEALQPVTFETKNSEEEGVRFLGFIAEEVEKAGLPEVIVYRDNLPDALSYDRFCAVLVNAVKELSEKVKQLEARLP